MTKALVFFSGGMDSFIHLYWAQLRFDQVEALYVDFGHRYAQNELRAARALCANYDVKLHEMQFPLGSYEQKDSFLPLRNLYILELGSYLSDDLVFGMLYHETPPDKRPRFVRRMEKLLNEQWTPKAYYEKGREIKIWTPFSMVTKTGMLSWYLKNGGPQDAILETIGCYDPEGKCGQCISCFNRWIALTNNGMKEKYLRPPYVWAATQLVGGTKKRQRLLSPFALAYKWKYAIEIYRAISTVYLYPFRLAWRIKKAGNLSPIIHGRDVYDSANRHHHSSP